jgi:NodT family efflux transporter outer membrane factor (OMF) lipoprotein
MPMAMRRASPRLHQPAGDARRERAGVTPGVVFCGAMLLSGCAVGPDFERPEPPPVSGYTVGRLPASTAAVDGVAQRFYKGRDVPGEWWTLFRSNALKALIEEGLANNPDLEAAQAALRIARENTAAQRGFFFPSVDASFDATRQKLPADVTGAVPNPRIFNVFTAQVSVSYTPDVFGANFRSVESLEATAENQRYQLEATHITLATNIVLAVVQEASLRGQIAATERIIRIVREVLDLMRRQRALGQISEADVVAQEAALAQVEQTLPPLQRQLEQQRHLITALIGRLPSREPTNRKFTLESLRLPRNLPVTVPSTLVSQRPDIRAAEANVHSTSALIGVAIANRLPNITISANDGSQAFDISKLFTPGTGFWTLTGNVLQPVFRGGTLYHRELAARAAFDQSVAQYRSTVITAFQNVADVLSALRTDAVALDKAIAAERAALRSLDIARQRQQLGDISFLLLLNAQQTYQQALLNVVQARANRFADTAALFQALGGGWWNRPNAEPERPLTIADFFQ